MPLMEKGSAIPVEVTILECTARIHALEELLDVSELAFLDGASKMEKVNTDLETLNESLVHEIDERKKAEEKLQAAYDALKQMHIQLLQSEKMASIGQLAAGVAHEINNPTGYVLSNLSALRKYFATFSAFIDIQSEALNTLSAYSEALKKLSASVEDDGQDVLGRVTEQRETKKIDRIMDDIGHLIDESIEGGIRIKEIVQNLKSFSRIDETEYAPADINAGLESTLSVIWNELKYKSAVTRDYGELPLTVCNLGQLNQVFMNILMNAVNAIKTQGQITIKTRYEENTVTVSISDTGSGIPQGIIDRIFEPFFTTKDVGKGTGLGLSIAYDIVKKHNGQIRVESEEGIGTTFTVSIPVVEKLG